MGEWRQRQLADGRKRVGVFSSEIPSQIAAPVRRPSNSSERDVSFAYEGFECSGVTTAVTDVAARIEPAIRVARQKRRRKSGDKRSSRSRRAREISSDLSRAATAKKKKKGGEKETWTKIRASRRSQVENAGPEKKIHTDVAGARRRSQIHVPCRGCRRLPLQRRTGAQMIIRRHGNARPIACPDAPCVDILVPFSHPLPIPRSSPTPFQTILVGSRRPPSSVDASKPNEWRS